MMTPEEFMGKLFDRLLVERDRHSTRLVSALSGSCDDRIVARARKNAAAWRRRTKIQVVESNELGQGRMGVLVRKVSGHGLKEEQKFVLKRRGSSWTVMNVLLKCWRCNGTALCNSCLGTGTDCFWDHRCKSCKGTKVCHVCKGKGWIPSLPARFVV